MAVGEWDQRQLCPDGGCVGVIGPDGTCKVCGRAAPNWGDERKRGLIDPPDEGDEDDDASDALAADGKHNGGHQDGDDAGDDDADDDVDDEDADDDADGEAEGDDDAAEDRGDAAAGGSRLTASSDEWGTRRLCPDGGCIGLIGPDRRCNVCGKVAA